MVTGGGGGGGEKWRGRFVGGSGGGYGGRMVELVVTTGYYQW